MKRIFTSGVCVLMLFLTILSTSCRNDRAELVSQEKGRKLTLTASMPQNEAGMRVGLEKGADGNTLAARWKAGDKVAFIFEQTGTLTAPVEVTISSIEQDGKLARLSIEVPEIINVQQEYTIHAFCGIPGTGARVQDGEILVDILPLRENRLEDMVVPVMAKEDVDPDDTDIELDFSHLGSIEYVDLKNSSGEELRVSNCHLYPMKGDAEEWRYVPGNGKTHFYKVSAENVLSVDGTKPNPIEESGSAVSIAPGATHTFAVWHYPKKRNIPEFGISMQTDGGALLSRNTRAAKPFGMTPGKAYRVRAEWKANRLMILGDDVEVDLPSITLTTEKKVGEKIKLSINAEPADQADVWIDLNNNKVKDAGESVTEFGPDKEYTLGSQTITVHGKVTRLSCSSNSLTSLDVSKNTALTWLYCDENSLTSLDVSKNTALTYLYCDENSLTSLDVSKNTALTELYCHSNSLTSLDVSKNTALTELVCSSNSLTSLDVSKNTELEWLDCNSNSLTSLDVSKNTALTYLCCDENSLTSLDVSKNTALTRFSCEKNPNLSSLKISSSINDALWVNHCKLSTETLNEIFTTLPDVKGQSSGEKKIWIANNPGTAACNKKIATDKGWKLDVEDTPPAGYSMTMTTTKAVGEKIKLSINAEPEDQADVWIDLNNNKVKDAGESVTVFGSDQKYTLGAQTVTVYGKVTGLGCIANLLTSLDVSKNTALTTLYCSSNSLTSLDVSKNTALTTLSCTHNSLTSLDVSKNTALTIFSCEKNPNLSSLKISRSINDGLYIRECKLSAETLNEIFRTLPDVTGQTEGYKKVWIAGNPGTAACNKKIATDKGWKLDVEDTPPAGYSMTMTTEKKVGEKIKLSINAEPEDQADVWIDLNNNKVKDAGESVTEFGINKGYTLGAQTVTVYGKVTGLGCIANLLTSLDVSKNTALTRFDCYNNSLTSLDVSKNTALAYLSCGRNSLTSLDVSKNTALTRLYCSSNSLTSLDVSKNTELEWLYCNSNSLTSLDVSKNTELEWLYCNSNSLTSLDVSKNTALTVLYCDENSLTSLDVSKNTALTRFSCEKNPNLSSLKISRSINDGLYIRECKLSAETLNEIFRTLPDVTGQTEGYKKVWIAGNPGTATCNKKIATDKGWTVSLDPIS